MNYITRELKKIIWFNLKLPNFIVYRNTYLSLSAIKIYTVTKSFDKICMKYLYFIHFEIIKYKIFFSYVKFR